MGADSMAIDKVALPCPTTFRHSWLWESFRYSFLPDPETASDVAWMALAWHTGVLEHQPGMLKRNTYAAMSATDLFSILPCVYKKSALLLAA